MLGVPDHRSMSKTTECVVSGSRRLICSAQLTVSALLGIPLVALHQREHLDAAYVLVGFVVQAEVRLPAGAFLVLHPIAACQQVMDVQLVERAEELPVILGMQPGPGVRRLVRIPGVQFVDQPPPRRGFRPGDVGEPDDRGLHRRQATVATDVRFIEHPPRHDPAPWPLAPARRPDVTTSARRSAPG